MEEVALNAPGVLDLVLIGGSLIVGYTLGHVRAIPRIVEQFSK